MKTWEKDAKKGKLLQLTVELTVVDVGQGVGGAHKEGKELLRPNCPGSLD